MTPARAHTVTALQAKVGAVLDRVELLAAVAGAPPEVLALGLEAAQLRDRPHRMRPYGLTSTREAVATQEGFTFVFGSPSADVVVIN